MQNQNEGKVLGKEVLGLDPEIRELVENRALSYGLSYCWSTYKTKKQVSVPVAESILLTDPLSSLQKNGSSNPIQYLSFILLIGCCLRFEGRSPSVTQGLCVCTRGCSGHHVLHRYPAKESVAD